MKTIFTSLLLFFLVLVDAQTDFYVHKAISTNIFGNATKLDHPRLNNKPNASFVISHVWNPPGGSSVYNNKISGLYYDGAYWVIYNQDNSDFIPNSSFFVYIPEPGWGAQFTVTDANINDGYADLDYGGTNNNPEAIVVANPIYTTYINKNIGLWYTGSKWSLFNENSTSIGVGQKFMIAMPISTEVSYKHQSSVSNITDNWTVIDHPLLNNNPNAKFVFTHNWGAQNDSSNVIHDKVVGAWYDGARWCLYNEDQTAFPVNVLYNLIIDGNSMGVEDAELTKISVYPNPMVNEVKIQSENFIQDVRVYTTNAEEVMRSSVNSKEVNLNVSKLSKGVYVFVIQTDKGIETLKLIKK